MPSLKAQESLPREASAAGNFALAQLESLAPSRDRITEFRQSLHE